MKKLAFSLRGSDIEEVNSMTSEYKVTLNEWNDKLGIFFAKLPYLSTGGLALYLESQIQSEIRSIGRNLELMIRQRRSGELVAESIVTKEEGRLNCLQGRAINFNKKLTYALNQKKADIYYGKKIQFSEYTIHLFPTWKLFKALFVRNVHSLTVTSVPPVTNL